MLSALAGAMRSNLRRHATLRPQLLGPGAVRAPSPARPPRRPDARGFAPLASAPSRGTGLHLTQPSRPGSPVVTQEESVPFTAYSPAVNAAYWATRPVTVAQRGLQIGGALLTWLVRGYLMARGSPGEVLQQRAEALRAVLVDLGAAAVKIGQAVSSRWDGVWPRGEARRPWPRRPPADRGRCSCCRLGVRGCRTGLPAVHCILYSRAGGSLEDGR